MRVGHQALESLDLPPAGGKDRLSTTPGIDGADARSMSPFAAAAPDKGLTQVGFSELLGVLALSVIVGVAVLMAFAVAALWVTLWQEADELGDR